MGSALTLLRRYNLPAASRKAWESRAAQNEHLGIETGTAPHTKPRIKRNDYDMSVGQTKLVQGDKLPAMHILGHWWPCADIGGCTFYRSQTRGRYSIVYVDIGMHGRGTTHKLGGDGINDSAATI
jgi:hypothetical protein